MRTSWTSAQTILLISMLILNHTASGQSLNEQPGYWQTFGPDESIARIATFLHDPGQPSMLFADAGNGLFRSTSAGLRWSRLATPNNASATALLIENGRIFVAVPGNGLFSSAISGETAWARVGEALANETIVQLIKVGNVFHAGTAAGTVYFSSDGGQQWQQGNAELHGWPVRGLVALSADTLFVLGARTVLRSVDGGRNWQEFGAPVVGDRLAAIAGKVYITMAGGVDFELRGIWRSTDGGATWQRTTGDQGTVRQYQGLVAAENTLFAWAWADPWDDNTERGAFLVSLDGGASWRDGGLIAVTGVASVSGVLVASTARNGVWLSYDRGTNWVEASPPLSANQGKGVLRLHQVGTTLYASVLDIFPRDVGPPGWLPGGLYISTDNARNWTRSIQGLTLNSRVVEVEADLNYVLARSNDRLFRSTDLGVNWTDITKNLDVDDFGQSSPVRLFKVGGSVFLSFIADRNIFYSRDTGLSWNRAAGGGILWTLVAAGGNLYGGSISGRVLRSGDGGLSWTQTGLATDASIFHILLAGGTIFAGTDADGLFSSIDDGATWLHAPAPLDSGIITQLVATRTSIVAGTTSGAYLSRDNGRSWLPGAGPIQNRRVTTFTGAGNQLHAGTNAGALVSGDDGASWTLAVPPLDAVPVSHMLAIGDRVYAGTPTGVFWTFADDGRDWYPLNTGMGRRTINDLSYITVSNRLFAATNDGAYLQTLDAEPPVANAFILGNGAAFTQRDTVNMIFAANGADSLIFAETDDFSDARWQEYTSLGTTVLSAGDGPKTIYAKFKDISFNQSPVLSAQIVLDLTDPDFVPFPHAQPSGARPRTAITISQQVDDANLASFDLLFRRAGEVFDPASRRISFANNIAVIDSERVNNRGLDYQIVASDRAGRSTVLKNGELDFFSLPVALAANGLGSSPSLPGGTGGVSYRLVSLPLDLPPATAAKSAFGDIGTYGPGASWRLFDYRGQGEWQEGENTVVQTGGAYFLLRRSGGSLSNALAGTTSKTSDGVRGTIPGWVLRGGDWTAIGNPYNTRIELNQLKLQRRGTRLSQHGVDVQVWAYDGSWKNPVNNPDLDLPAWGGLFVRSAEADTLVFASAAEPFARATGKAAVAGADPLQTLVEGEWVVQVLAGSGEFHDTANYFGLRRAAAEGMDDLDWYEPPLLPGAAGASFRLGDGDAAVELAADFRPPDGDGQRWDLVVRGAGGAAVQLRFAQLETVPESYRLLLIDESTKIARDLRQEATLTLRIPDAGTKRLALLAGDDFYIRQHSDGLLGVPTAFALEQNYPNPFNPSTTIRYALPAAGRVTLEIFDLLGKRVLRLVDAEAREAGYYETVADMAGLGSGMYFYRLSVDGEQRFQATKKMVYVK